MTNFRWVCRELSRLTLIATAIAILAHIIWR